MVRREKRNIEDLKEIVIEQKEESQKSTVIDIPSSPAQFRRKFASLFLKEDFEAAHLLSIDFMNEHPAERNCLEEVKRAFEQLGAKEDLLKVYDLLLAIDPEDAKILKEREELELMDDLPLGPELLNEESSVDFPLPADQDIADFLNLFQGRENVYARQWTHSSGKTGYTPVTEPLNFKVVKNHLFGNYSVGLYQLDTDNNVKWLAFDIDVRKDTVEQLADKGVRDRLFGEMRSIFIKMKTILKEFDIPIYLEESGYKGYHVWLFLEEKISARHAMEFAQLLLRQIVDYCEEIQIEIFPKQIKASQLGNLLKLPLGIHQVTGKRSYFVDDKFQPILNYRFLSEIRQISAADFLSALHTWKLKEDILPALKKMKAEDYDAISDLPELPQEEPFVPEDYPPFQWLLSKCTAIAALVDKIEKTGELTNLERIALTHSCGNMDKGHKVVNELLHRMKDVSQEFFLKSSLKGNVISCYKIRQYLKQLVPSEKCNCRFDSILNSYPHPLLHLREMDKIGSPQESIDELRLKQLVDTYLQTKKEFNELTRKLKNQEKILNDYLEKAGVEEIVTSFGKFKRDPQTKIFTIEL